MNLWTQTPWITPPPSVTLRPIRPPAPPDPLHLRWLYHVYADRLARLPELWQLALELLLWTIALVWLWRTHALLFRLREVPILTDPEWDLGPAAAPGAVIVVPARNEEAALPAAMATLLAQDYGPYGILAIDDRSTDRTGAIMDSLAADHPAHVKVLHIDHLPEGWMGKTWALEVAARQIDPNQATYLLFTDADVLMAPSILRRALTFAELTEADHVVVMPSPEIRSFGEGLLLAFLQLVALWPVRPWLIPDPKKPWDSVGVGAFNLIRHDAWDSLGGFAPQRMAVLEDITLGRRVKAAGLRQRIAFAPGRICVHWAPGLGGIVRGMGKNLFAGLNFNLLAMAAVASGLFLIFLLPIAALLWPRTLIPSLLILAAIAAQYRTFEEVSGIPARYGWAYPLGAVVLIWALLRSAALAIRRQGIVWRSTHYPLDELRRHNSPFTWLREARAERDLLREDRRRHRRSWLRRIRKER